MVDNPFLIAKPSLQTGIDSSFAIIEQYFNRHAQQVRQLTKSMNEQKKQLENKVNTLEQTMTGKLQIQEAHFTAMMGNMGKFHESIGKLNKRIDKLKRKLKIERVYRKKLQADQYGDDMVNE